MATQPTLSPENLLKLASAAGEAGFDNGNIDELVAVIKTFRVKAVFAEARCHVSHTIVDGVARGVRPPHTSKRRYNDPNHVTG